jgi:amphi-Trp domain-containing protein
MGEETVLFESEEAKDIQSVSRFLHELADQVAEKQVVLGEGEDKLIITLPDNVELEIEVEVEVEDGKVERSLEIEIEWTESNDTDTV